jgi:hypothetical protein
MFDIINAERTYISTTPKWLYINPINSANWRGVGVFVFVQMVVLWRHLGEAKYLHASRARRYPISLNKQSEHRAAVLYLPTSVSVALHHDAQCVCITSGKTCLQL